MNLINETLFSAGYFLGRIVRFFKKFSRGTQSTFRWNRPTNSWGDLYNEKATTRTRDFL
jgi:hypothetical protein